MAVTVGAVRERTTLLENKSAGVLNEQKDKKEKIKIKDMIYLCNFESKII